MLESLSLPISWRKHFKVVLLDLYVASFEHPDLKLAVPMWNVRL